MMLYIYLVCDKLFLLFFFFFNDTATTEIYTLSLHDALPISSTLLGCEPSSHTWRSSSDRAALNASISARISLVALSVSIIPACLRASMIPLYTRALRLTRVDDWPMVCTRIASNRKFWPTCCAARCDQIQP